MFVDLTLQVGGGRGEIDGGGFDVAMAHHARNGVNIGPAFQHEGGEGMSEHMRVKIDTAFVSKLVHQPLNGFVGDRLVAFH